MARLVVTLINGRRVRSIRTDETVEHAVRTIEPVLRSGSGEISFPTSRGGWSIIPTAQVRAVRVKP